MRSGIHESRFFLSNFHASRSSFSTYHASRINPLPPSWHRLKVKSAVRVEDKGDSIQAADPQNSTMKRDVQKMRDEMKSGIIKIEETFKPFKHHVYTVLKNSTIGPTTSLFQHLEHRYSLRRTQATVDHDRNLIVRKESIAIMKLN